MHPFWILFSWFCFLTIWMLNVGVIAVKFRSLFRKGFVVEWARVHRLICYWPRHIPHHLEQCDQSEGGGGPGNIRRTTAHPIKIRYDVVMYPQRPLKENNLIVTRHVSFSVSQPCTREQLLLLWTQWGCKVSIVVWMDTRWRAKQELRATGKCTTLSTGHSLFQLLFEFNAQYCLQWKHKMEK